MKYATFLPIIVSALLLGLIGVGNWFWYQEITRVRSESATLAADITTAFSEHEQGARVRSLETELAESEAFIAAHIVKDADIVSFLGYVEGTGRPAGALVEVASVSDIDAEGRILVSLTITGNFDALMRTLGMLEHGPYALSVKSATMEAREEGWALNGTFYTVAARTP